MQAPGRGNPAALRAGQLSAVACDVFAAEPLPLDDPLVAQERALLSPHVAYLSPSSLRRYAEIPARNVLALLEHGTVPGTVLEGPAGGGGGN